MSITPNLNLATLGRAVQLAAAGNNPASVRKASSGGPWLRIKQTRTHTDVALTLQLAEGQWWTFCARVHHKSIRRVLQRHGIEYEVGFSLGGLWKGIKKVAKATGVSKVLSVASKVLENPIVTAVFPVASVAARATKAGVGLLNAATAAKKGSPADKAKATAMVKEAKRLADGGNPVAQKALKVATRAYRIVVKALPEAA
jgi:hypothetical protein